jgi:hypothetical protein
MITSKTSDIDLQTLATLEQCDYWRALKSVLDEDLKLLESEVEMSPRLSDEDLTEDLRFKMGAVARLKQVLRLPDEARALLK